MRKSTIACLAAVWVLASGQAPGGQRASVRLEQTANLGAVRVTPRYVIEDSRCPKGQTCADAGTLRVRALIDSPQGSHSRELVVGKVERIAGGQLVLEGARPEPIAGAKIAPGDYRFTIRFRAGT